MAGLSVEQLAEIEPRFWSKVNKDGPIHPVLGTACWLWTASVTGSRGVQHGQFTYRVDGPQIHVKAHRFAYELTTGPIPPGIKACHFCDIPRCTRPSHLFLGTQDDNLFDARQKGRLRHPRSWAKLSADDIVTIRRDYRPRRNGKALAARYGVTLHHLLRVVRGTGPVVTEYAFKAVTPQLQQQPDMLDSAGFALDPVPYRQLVVRGEIG